MQGIPWNMLRDTSSVFFEVTVKSSKISLLIKRIIKNILMNKKIRNRIVKL